MFWTSLIYEFRFPFFCFFFLLVSLLLLFGSMHETRFRAGCGFFGFCVFALSFGPLFLSLSTVRAFGKEIRRDRFRSDRSRVNVLSVLSRAVWRALRRRATFTFKTIIRASYLSPVCRSFSLFLSLTHVSPVVSPLTCRPACQHLAEYQ